VRQCSTRIRTRDDDGDDDDDDDDDGSNTANSRACGSGRVGATGGACVIKR